MQIKQKFRIQPKKNLSGVIVRCAIIVLVMLMQVSTVFAQRGNTVTGTVTDNGVTMPGANVTIKGTTTGTITDANGQYSITVPNRNDVLVFSFIGYETLELEVGERTRIDVELQSSSLQMDEVVVTGYAVQRRVNLSGAVDNISLKTLQAKPIVNVAQGLQGLVPNLNIWLGSGQPGANANINIRGITSVNGGQPLLLIDGIPSETSELNRLAPNDIESISVLKDASSSAIYGARAAFGVILITTRKGSSETDRISVDFTSNFIWKKATVLPDKVPDPYIFARLLQTSTDNTPWSRTDFTDYQLEWARQRSDNPSVESVRLDPLDNTLYDYMGGTDWTRHYLDNYTFSHNQQVSISGNSAKSVYYLSANSAKEYGAIKFAKDNFTRNGFRSNVDYKLLNNLTVSNNTSYITTVIDLPTYMNIQELFDVYPTSVDLNPNGTYANSTMGHILSKWTTGGRSNDRDDLLTSTFTAKWELFDKMLIINGDYTFRRKVNDYRWNYAKYMIGYGPNDNRELGRNEAYRRYIATTYNVMNLYANLNKSFAQHTLSAIIGFNQEKEIYDGYYGRIDQLVSASLPSLNLATGTPLVGDWYSDWAVRGIFGRLNYTFDNKYILEFNGRYDGSSRFPKENRFALFPSFSAAWRIDRENFMDNVGWINMLKIRGSYGSLGNQAVSNYGYITTMERGLASPIINVTRPLKVDVPNVVSPNYSWEVVTTINGGIDVGFFNNRLTSSFDIYRRNTTGMLVPGKELPGLLGTGAPKENAADLKTTGWEWTLSYNNSTMVASKMLSFNARFVLSDSRSFITRFDNPSKRFTQYYEGMEIGEMWGLVNDGFFSSQDEIDALDQRDIVPWDALAIVKGWPKYVDLDSNGRIEIGTSADDPKDVKIIGNSSPRYNFGFNLGASWNGIDFDMFIQGVGKRDFYPIHFLYWGFYQQPYAGGYRHLLDFYRENDDPNVSRHSQAYIDAGLASQNLDAKYPVLQSWLADRNLGEWPDPGTRGLAIPQTGYMLNGAYLRMKSLTIGYTLPHNLTGQVGIQRLRIYVSGENLFEFSELKKYFDPEAINSTDVNDMTRTSNGYTYPFQRRYTVGLNVTF